MVNIVFFFPHEDVKRKSNIWKIDFSPLYFVSSLIK